MNDRQDSLTGKLLNARPFLFNIPSSSEAIKATRIELDIGNECTLSDNFLGEIPTDYKNKNVKFEICIYNNKSRGVQVWDQTLSCEDLEPVKIYYEFKI
jgi:hypothetical protein